MLCYAWNRVEEVKKLNLKGIKGNNFYDLLSLALCNSVSKIIKRGIYKEYIKRKDRFWSKFKEK